ncbi:glucosamine-6-phosphate deaminase [Butyrivibrio sp. VCD2006]|uniref:glucosamine-6-phosphate deaminase n=1 Tax=Butyrivibrio sp. VCD2006 TaxID=1280664 RepID=UPI0003F8526B|nr:glucosamine-6-phosphate deaminase [Butyrivibrio sp. VCD2006]
MRVYKAVDYNDLSRKAANIISAQIIMKPDAVLGMATGSSPIGTYKQLVEWYKKGDLDFSEIKTINLDEYMGIGPENEQSYHFYMRTNLFDHVNIKPENTFIPDGLEEDGEKECARYDEVINSCGGIDLQLLGIGGNGHIGFNEPGTSFGKTTHQVALSESTIEANSRFFSSIDEVPKYAYSMGIKNIMQAKNILLIASGINKAEALQKAFFGPITPAVPASILQLHNNVTIVADEDALSAAKW